MKFPEKFLFLFLLITISISVTLIPSNHPAEPVDRKPIKTAVWLKPNPDSAFNEILSRIKRYNISLIYLRVSKKILGQPDRIKYFISRVKAESPGTQIYPWVSMIIRSPNVFKKKGLLQDFIVFLNQNNLSGLHLDFEPPFGSQTFEYLEEYFFFLSTIKTKLKPGKKKLSIAIFPQMVKIFYEKNTSKRERFRSLAKNIDQYVLMMYDTGIREEVKFLNHMITHIGFMNRLIGDKRDQEIIIGIASYGWHSNRAYRWMHDPGIENIKTTINLLKQYQNLHPGQIVINGYAIFRFGTIDQTEWKQYTRLIR